MLCAMAVGISANVGIQPTGFLRPVRLLSADEHVQEFVEAPLSGFGSLGRRESVSDGVSIGFVQRFKALFRFGLAFDRCQKSAGTFISLAGA